MKVITDNHAAGEQRLDALFDGSPTDSVLVGIGEELRSAYGSITGRDQPEHLLDLAQKLETLMAEDGDGR